MLPVSCAKNEQKAWASLSGARPHSSTPLIVSDISVEASVEAGRHTGRNGFPNLNFQLSLYLLRCIGSQH